MSATATTLRIAEQTIELRAGEHYAGIVLDEHGQPQHHLILLAERPDGRLAWQPAMDWAARVGGALPNRKEQSLLFAHCKEHLQPRWHWSCQEHESDASYAWYCYFLSGDQRSLRKSYEACAVAVRRLPLTA